MGLDAAVSCRCWENGLCDPPASLAPRLWYDPVRAEVNQTVPEHLPEREDVELHVEHYLWVMQGACAHEHMRVARERISNWGGLRAFQHALRSTGKDLCATLLREIPDGNGGMTTPAAARICLDELDRFRLMGEFGTAIELVEGGSGQVVQSLIAPYHGWFSTNGATGISFRLSMDATLQIERGKAGVMSHDPDAQVIFRSRAFSQVRTADGQFRFTDLSSGEQLLCSDGIQDASRGYPASFKVGQRTDAPTRYAYCVEPLRRVFQAAIDTDHPVLWC